MVTTRTRTGGTRAAGRAARGRRSRRGARPTPEARRADLLDAAESCFAEHGYHATTVDAIAERAGVSKGAVYWHFESKRDVFTALVDRLVDAVQPRWQELALGPSPAAALRQMLAAAPDLSRPGVALADASLEYMAEASRDPALSRRLGAQLRSGCEIVAELIRRGTALGEFREVDADAYAAAIVAAGKGLQLLAKVDTELDFERAWAAMIDLSLRGLAR
jgi:TetR/AcrR family acrAB operon transcriptional repressor